MTLSPLPTDPAPRLPSAAVVALSLALATAISLGLARFSYALMLPPMRADLGWSYLTAGAMNTANAAGYLIGALLAPAALRRCPARQVMLAGGVASGLLLWAHGALRSDEALYLLRGLTGVASAAMFVAGGLLAARLASRPGLRSGLVLGVYYGGVGAGIIVSAWLVPAMMVWAVPADGAAWVPWQAAWWALGAAALLATGVCARGTRELEAPALAAPASSPVSAAAAFPWRRMAWSLASYFLFGVGYIGYMTFVISLLRERHVADLAITGFYSLLGLGVLASSWLWAGALQRHRGGRVMAWLNGLLIVATLLPVLSAHPVAALVSGLLFGSVFLSVVASTTAEAWPEGIAVFTVVFAVGQIVGPTLVGWLADGAGGLSMGLAVSAGVHALAALMAWRQRPFGV
jgi:predicted MFS family arabinose efflux permease